MTTPVPSKTDLMYEILYNPNFVLIPSPKVKVKITDAGGEKSYQMKDHATGTYYNIDELTNFIWNLTDGKRTVTQITEEAQRQRPRIRERTVLEIILFFAECNLLLSSIEVARKKRFKVVSAFEVNFCLVENSKGFLQAIYSKIKPVFKRSLLWAAIIYIAIGAALFASEFVSIYGKKAYFEILGSSVVGFLFYYFVALAPVIIIHEIAHGISLLHYGGQPGEMGTGLFYFGPMFYTETTDAWGISRRDRMMVYLAGNITTLFIGATLVFVRLIVQIPPPASLVVTVVAFYCFSMSLLNFAPPFETDGYYVLSDAVKMPNLRRDSYGYVGSIIRRAFGLQKKTKSPSLTKRQKRIFLIYAALSVTWIIYIVFQTSIFFVYMAQDVVTSLSSLSQAILSSQLLPASTVIIAVASILYFGMQVAGYGFVFSVAIKKAAAKPLVMEAIHDRNLTVFAYLPLQVPEWLSHILKSKMEEAAKKYTPNFVVKQIGRSCVAILKMGGTSLGLTQIHEHLKKVESEFSSVYQNLILTNKESLQSSTGIYAVNKIELTTMFERFAQESADAGNPEARSIVKVCKEKQNETLLYLLSSVFGTVWMVEAHPALEYDIEKELASDMLVEDLTLTDLYNDCENFKKSVVYGFDSLAKLATEMDASVRDSLARPDEYQLVSVFEPIKSRILFVGRTEELEKNIDLFAPLFVAQTWSGYLDNTLKNTCFTLYTLNKALLPNIKELKEMSIGELAVLTKDLSLFAKNQKIVDKSIENSETRFAKINQTLQELETMLKTQEKFRIGGIDAIFQVNSENFAQIPHRIKELRKEWKKLCKALENMREHIEKEYNERKTLIASKKRRLFKIYPLVAVLSIIAAFMGFQSSMTIFSLPLLSIALIIQAIYWLIFYRVYTSFRNVTRYPSQTFSRIHIFILALTEAVYRYATTEDILTLQ